MANDRLKLSSGFLKYFNNTSWMFTERIIRVIVGFIVGVWVVRHLGAERFGVLSYALAFTSLFAEASNLGIGGILMRDLVSFQDKKDEYLGTGFWLKLFAAFIMIAIIVIIILLSSWPSKTSIVVFIIACGMIFQSFDVLDFFFSARVLSKYSSICKGVQLAVSSLLKIYLIFIDADLVWFAFVSALDQVVLAVSLFIVYRSRESIKFIKCFKLDLAWHLVKVSWPMMFSGFATLLLMRIDQIMINALLGDKAVGIYAAAVKLSSAWFFVPMIISKSVFPSIIESKKRSLQEYQRKYLSLFSLLGWMAICVAVVITLVGKDLVYFLFGEEFVDSGTVIIILSWAGVFISLGKASNKWFISEDLQRYILIRVLSGVFCNILLNMLLVPIYGIAGAAFATLISYSVSFYFSYLVIGKLRILFKMTTMSFNPGFALSELKNHLGLGKM